MLLLTSIFVSSGHQETVTPGQFSNMRDTAKQIEAAHEEDEEGEGDKEVDKIEENSRGCNWKRARGTFGGKIWGRKMVSCEMVKIWSTQRN